MEAVHRRDPNASGVPRPGTRVEPRPRMDEVTGLGAAGALMAGLSGSVHCALMCGPLACAGAGASRRAAAAWQLSRLVAYSALGALLGATGSAAVGAFAAQARPVLPWVMAAGLVATALELPKRLPALPMLRRVSAWVVAASAALAPEARAGAMGAVTPLLPCGLVYGLSLAALASGSMGAGLAIMGAFALGGVPALAAVQLQGGRLSRLGRFGAVARLGLPLAAAGVLVWRVLTTSDAGAAPSEPPHCH
jgi:sulfite exporter TauE/SafE